MIGRLPSGQDSLDLVLGGGLPENAINLIAGLPGTGKTLLAEQYLFRNTSPERPGVYCVTTSEPFEKIVRYGQTLSFFDPSAVGRSVFYEDLASVLRSGSLAAVVERLSQILRERRPAVLVIDSFKALQTYAADRAEYRRFVSELAARVSALSVNAFWVGEYEVDDLARDPEFAVADSIISLQRHAGGERILRSLQVLKLRGSGFRSGSHAYRLSADGLHVFPRLADIRVEEPYEVAAGRLSTGLSELDAMLGGGLLPGTATLIAGPSGSGKTLLALRFLLAAAGAGERAVYAGMQENPTQLWRVMDAFGWERAGVEVLYRSPVDVYIDEWVYEVLETVERTGARRLVIDSLSDLRVASPDQTRFQEYMYSLVQRSARAGVNLLMTLETAALGAGPTTATISHLADTVILLRHSLETGRMRRAIAVLKARASAHDQALRPFDIDGRGIRIAAAESVDWTQPDALEAIAEATR